MKTIEQTIDENEKKLILLQKELGDKTMALYAQEPYRTISYSNEGIYRMIQGDIKRIESQINMIERIIEYGKKLLEPSIIPTEDPTIDEYDQWLGYQGIN